MSNLRVIYRAKCHNHRGAYQHNLFEVAMMDSPQKKSSSYSPLKRLAAVCFIVLIIFGNFWFAYIAIGTTAPEWVVVGFKVVAFVTFLVAVASAGAHAFKTFQGRDLSGESELLEASENQREDQGKNDV